MRHASPLSGTASALAPRLRPAARPPAGRRLVLAAALVAGLFGGWLAPVAPAAMAQSLADHWGSPDRAGLPPAGHRHRPGPHFGGEARMGVAWSSTDGFRFVSSAEVNITFNAHRPGGVRFGATIPVPQGAWQPDLSPGR